MTTNDLNTQLQEIADSTDFPPTLSTADLNGKTFTINNTRLVTTKHGDRHIGDIVLDGEHHEAWLTGSKLHPQVNALLIAGLPQTVCLTKGEGDYDPYTIQVV